MRHDRLDEPFAKTVGAVLFVDEDIAKISEDGVIADDACQTDLFVTMIHAKDKRMIECALGVFARTPRCPIGTREHLTMASRSRRMGRC